MNAGMNGNIKVLTEGPVLEIDGVRYHHHPNGGGLVAETAQVADTVYVGPCSKVCGHCKVSDDVIVFGNAWISDKAEVSGSAQIFGSARVYGNARVQDDAKIYGCARVHGDAVITGATEVFEKAEIAGNALLFGNARITGDVKLFSEPARNGQPAGRFIESLLERLVS